VAPDLDVLVRARKPSDVDLLYQLGAKEVVQPELEASLELVAHLMSGLGMPSALVQQQVQEVRLSRYQKMQPERSLDQVSRELKVAARDLNNKWYALPEDSPLLGMTLEETGSRRLTGISLMAIRRAGGVELDYPDGEVTLEQGDRLLIVGDGPEIVAFDELAKGEAAVPSADASCQWLRMPADSPMTDRRSETTGPQTLLDLDLPKHYGVQVQALRRDGKFTRFPEGPVEEGDLLLLCGPLEALRQVRERLVATAVGVGELNG
jgi:monovalent cation:H+ antiporter-2, CPA2 family